MTIEEFKIAIKELNIVLTEEQLEKLNKFYYLLIEWNKKLNLTRITKEQEVYLKHFYDSLTLVKAVNLEEKETLCDVGSGAGFPGIVLKIAFPHLKVTLLDSLNKRVVYLNEIIKELELDNIKAIHTRAEDYKETFDIVTARAVANIEKLIHYTGHLISQVGVLVAMKGNIDQELTESIKERIEKKYKITSIKKFLLPKENSMRSLIIIERKN